MASPYEARARRGTPRAPNAYVLPVSGELDLTAAPVLREQLLAAITDGHDDVVLDLSGVTFVDSSGLSVIITAYKRLQAEGGRLRVAGASGLVRSVLDVTGLGRILGEDGADSHGSGREVARLRGAPDGAR